MPKGQTPDATSAQYGSPYSSNSSSDFATSMQASNGDLRRGTGEWEVPTVTAGVPALPGSGVMGPSCPTSGVVPYAAELISIPVEIRVPPDVIAWRENVEGLMTNGFASSTRHLVVKTGVAAAKMLFEGTRVGTVINGVQGYTLGAMILP